MFDVAEHHDMLSNFAPKVRLHCSRIKGNYFALIQRTHSHGQVKLIPEAHETAMANKRLFEDLGFGEEGAEVVVSDV